MADQSLTYRDAGVDIERAERALANVADLIRQTHDARVVGGIGGFGSLYSGQFQDLQSPLLVASIDGVGTKTKVAAMVGEYRSLGMDIVNHCVNDILCQGAKPLFFLDYFGCSRLDPKAFEEVLGGAVEACRENGCALIGGETAEMPHVYVDDEIDVVGAIVGVVDAEHRIPRGKMQPGDALVGLASNGLHTNGFSLARRALLEVGGLSVRDEVPGLGTSIGVELLRPHRSYLHAIYPLIQEVPDVLAVAHITGGGLFDNLPRVMPSDVQAVIDRRSWTVPPIFRLIQETGGVPDAEMYRTFNMGVGMVVVCRREVAAAVVQRLGQAGEMAAVIGEIQRGPHDVQIV